MNLTGFDFFDFGCSNGANIKYIQLIDLKARGLGIDIDQKKLDSARECGFEVINFDILKLPRDKLVRFVTMSHFLEHLPSVKVAEAMIRRGIDVSRDFVFIRQPWFDSDGALLLQNLKFYWSDWRGHPNRMTSLEFYLILKKALEVGAIRGFSIFGRSPITSTSEPSLIPLGAPIDQHHYDARMHGNKVHSETLDFKTFKEIVVIVEISGGSDWKRYLDPLGEVHLLQTGGVVAR